MDFPKFFRTAIQNLTIDAEKWRGLALLVKRPDHNYSLRGNLENNIVPATGAAFDDTDRALHVVFKGQKWYECFQPSLTFLPAIPGGRYYVHTAFLSARSIVTDTATYFGFRGYVDNVHVTCIRAYVVPLVAASYNVPIVLDVLFDVNRGIDFDMSAGNLANYNIMLTYSIVEAS
jgi:hypothetical protein